jgi:tRNA threonylcarbamoyl adenosine modification protein (Sua5/YciO/YrdC/YwlC family)
MSQFFQIHAENPQPRLVSQAVEILRSGGVIVYPTDSSYALGCPIGDKSALDRIRAIRRLDDRHRFTLVCGDISGISTYAKVDNRSFRLIRGLTPGPYTFILDATHEVPRRLLQQKRRHIGIRIPDNRIALALLEAHGEPILSSTLLLPGEEIPPTDPYEIRQMLERHVDLIIDGGYGGIDLTTVIHLEGDEPYISRQGLGEAPFLQ